MKQTVINKADLSNNFWKIRRILLFCFLLFVGFATLLSFPVTGYSSADVELLNASYGEENKSCIKILVAYATRAGSTIEVAQAIGKKLAENGAVVDVKPVKNVDDLKKYQAVVLGSAIRRGKVLPELMNFVQNNKGELEKIPVACFIVCMILREDNEQNRTKAASYIKPLQDDLSFVAVGFFTGKLDYSKLTFIDAFVVEHIIGTPEGDLRDWQKINDWAENIGTKLKNK